MRLFRLEPTYLDDPQWQASSVVETKLPSPWLSDSLTKCIPEKWVTDVPPGTLMLANDPRVSAGNEAP